LYHQILATKDIEVLDSLRLLAAAREKLVGSIVGYSQAQFDLWVALGNMPVAAGRQIDLEATRPPTAPVISHKFEE
jgi:hypothetical protein